MARPRTGIDEQLPVEQIVVGERRREDFGDIDALAASIHRFGLLHPIIVDDDNRLVAGERRLRAVRDQLCWPQIDVRRFGGLSEAERHEIELEENLQRKDLTTAERSRTLVKLADTARTIIKKEVFTESVKTSGGRPPKGDVPLQAVAERIGRPAQTIRDGEKHVRAMDAHPELARPGWKQYHALEAVEKLEKLPEPERQKAVALIAQPGIPPSEALPILKNLSEMDEAERDRIWTLAASADSRDRSRALTETAKKPAMPDVRMHLLIDASAKIGKAVGLFPNDPMNDRINAALVATNDALKAVKEYRRDA